MLVEENAHLSERSYAYLMMVSMAYACINIYIYNIYVLYIYTLATASLASLESHVCRPLLPHGLDRMQS